MTTYQYQGNGAFIPGIPARHLSEADVAKLTDEQVEALRTKHDGKQLYTKRSAPKGEGDAKAEQSADGA